MAHAAAFNTTIQQYSPLISYTGDWEVGTSRNDILFDEYRDGFRLTQGDDATLSFAFTGTGVWLYGARRGNHGNYVVTLDGTSSGPFDGSVNAGSQVNLFSAAGLEDKEHTLLLTNAPVETNQAYFDLDYITFETVSQVGKALHYIEAADIRWDFGSDWSVVDDIDAQYSDLLVTSQDGAVATLSFEGDTIQVFGTVGPSQGGFLVTIDDIESTTKWVNCNNDESGRNTLLFAASLLSNAKHTLRLEADKRGLGGRVEIDYAVTRNNKGLVSGTSSSDSVLETPDNNARSLSIPGLVGGILGAIAFLLLICAFLFWKLRLRRQASLMPTVAPVAHEKLGEAQNRDVEGKRASKWRTQMRLAMENSSSTPQISVPNPNLRSSTATDPFASPNLHNQPFHHEASSSSPPTQTVSHGILTPNISSRLSPPGYWQTIVQ